MGILEKLGKNKLIARQVAKRIPKEDLLAGLEDAWSTTISRNSDTEDELKKALTRIKESGYEDVFKSAGVTKEDLRQVIVNIKEGKSTPFVKAEPSVGRNDPCPCGSSKKYKRCCGSL